MTLHPVVAVFGTAAVCLGSPLVLAQDATTLDTIVVTADRKARTLDETLAPVSIITRADIEKYQATSVPDVLRRLPGISISNSGGTGKATSVFLRGTNSNHLLVLIDGVKVGSATTGSVAFEDVPLDQVERIEVVRGPRSSLYGSEALGGVIQIFTRSGGNGFQPEVSISAGSHNQQKANVNLAGGTDTTWYNVNAGTEQTDGFNATANNREPDADGYERDSASLRVGHRLANGTEVEATLLHAQGSNNYDGTFVNQGDFVQQALSGTLRHNLGDKVALTAQLGQAKDESDNFKDGAFGSRFNTTRDSASLQADVAVNANNALTLGVDQQQDKVDSTTVYTVASRDNTGLFANYQTKLGATQLELAVRQDDNQQFGDYTTGSLAVGRDLPNGMRVTAAHGTAFKAPTFNNLYFPNSGDASLKPEESQNTELGVSGKAAGKVRWSANAFSNNIDHLISYPPPTFRVSQTEKARIQGVELSAGTQLADWEVDANLTLQQPENRSGVNAGKRLINRPEHLFNVNLDRDLGKFRVGATVHAESQRYTDAANTESRKLPGYGTLDLRADYELAKSWTVGARLNNIADKTYQTNNGFNQDGVNGMVTVKYAPK